jgi:hypothetical protein
MALPIWIIITGMVLLVFLIIFRTMNQVYILSLIKKHAFWFIFTALIVFFAISLTHIHANYDIDLNTWEGITEAGNIYLNWLINVFKNLGKVTGYAVQQDWFTSSNQTG